MATFKTLVRTPRKDGYYQVYIRVVHLTKAGYIKTDKMVTKKQLTRSGEINDPFVLEYCVARIKDYNERLNRVDCSNWSVAEVIEYLQSVDEDLSFSDYARKHIDRMIDRGQRRNAKNYKLALDHMERFFGTTDIKFSDLTSMHVNRWIASLESTARAKEMYPVCIRQIFRAATIELNDYDNSLIRIKTNPWVKVKIPTADTPDKRAITAEACRAFFAAPLPYTGHAEPLPELGRDVAKMVLCLAGINTCDLFAMRKQDYHGGIIHYQRAKTRNSRTDGAYIEMRVPDVIKPLFEKYRASEDTELLFTFAERYKNTDSFNANVNNGIKKICESMGMKEGKYSVYTFRHTWATTAQNDCGASLSEVGFAMNHSQRLTKVTRGYVVVDFSPAWELNEKVIDFIFFSDARSKAMQHEQPEDEGKSVFRISKKMLIHAQAFFMGKCIAEFEDIGSSNLDEVTRRLVADFPATIPKGSIVQFKVENRDNGKTTFFEHQKGKGF